MYVILVTIVIAIISVLLYCYKYVKDAYNFWNDLGIPYKKPNFIFGNARNLLLKKIGMAEFHLQLYELFANYRFAGFFILQKPILIVRDPELIKHILTKDFPYFHDRSFKTYPKIEPLTQHLFLLNGQQWKNLRVKLTPTFTSGKMKLMFPLIEECAIRLTSILISSDVIDIDVKDFCSRYTTDVIGSCAFGLDTESIKNPNSQFRKMGRKLFEPNFGTLIRSVISNTPEVLIKLFGLQFIKPDISDFFITLVKDTVEYREKNKVTRNDFLNLLIQLKNSTDDENKDEIRDKNTSNIDMTTELMAAQCFLFFGAGFETSAGVMSFLLLELAQHPVIQNKLRDNINEALTNYDGKLTYYALKDMKYLDMVLCETTRKYPPVTGLNRLCSEHYKIPGSEAIVPKGTDVLIPTIGLHMDQQYYKNPEKFEPEHFSEEAILQRHQYAYLPFGEGPRVCIAERFAKMVVKTAIVQLIRNYSFKLSPKLKLPIEYDNQPFLAVKGGIWLQYNKI